MARNFLLILIFISSLILCQDYVWPTNTGKQLTSNFGEFRDKHFHMGLDIRTNSSIGHLLYAIDDGYIYRIATSFKGYGKVLYLKTGDNKIAVYGHLYKFSERLENQLFELQNENQSYIINKYFTQQEYPVKHGDIIGYSGNSGGSTGPHLHFEFRNDIDQPLNPMTNGFPVADTIHPQFLDLSIIPLAEGTYIDNSPLPQNYVPLRTSLDIYTIRDTILINGKFGITTRATDKIQDAIYSYQIEKMLVKVDSVSVFSIQYDSLDFSEGENISTVYGQPINHPKYNDLQKLYRLEPYPKLTIHSGDETGILNLSEGIHKIEIQAMDGAKNKSELTFYVKSDKSIYKNQYAKNIRLIDYLPFENDSSIFKPQLLQLEKGTIFQLNTNISNLDTIQAYIEKSDKTMTFPLIKIGDDKYASEMISPYFFKNSKSCGYLLFSNTIQKYEFDFRPVFTLPDSTHRLFSQDSLCTLEINNAFYDTTLMWITKQTLPPKQNVINRKSAVYKLHPYGIPFKNDISVSLVTKNGIDWTNYAVYTFNNKKSRWDFELSRIDTINSVITAKLSEANIFTVLEDTTPPVFLYNYPENQAVHSKDSLKTIKIILDDDLSGINYSEEYLKVYLDEKRIWVAYQPVDKEISYDLRNFLSLGEHNLLINIHDRSGNSASKSIKFFVE